MKVIQSSKMHNALKCLFVVGLVSSLAACGGDDAVAPGSVQAASSDLAAPVTGLNVAALAAQAGVAATPIVFPNGFSGDTSATGPAGSTVSISGPTTVTFTSSAATPTFKIDNGTSSATGTTSFGSCIFTVTGGTFAAPSPLAVNSVFRVQPCAINGSVKNMAVGTSASKPFTVTFGTSISTPFNLPVTYNANGTITVGSVTVGSVQPITATGAQ